MNEQTQMPFMAASEASALTPAERIQKLIELCLSHQALERKSTVADAVFQKASRIGHPDADKLGMDSDDTVGLMSEKGDEILKHVNELANDGLLDCFDRLLRNDALEADMNALRKEMWSKRMACLEASNRWIPATGRAHSRFRYPSQPAENRTGFFDLKGAKESVGRLLDARGVKVPPPQFPAPGHTPPARKPRMADRFFDLFRARSQGRKS